MLLHPEVQRRAQAELDQLLKNPSSALRLPDLSDRESLPYVQAIILEVMRWYPAVPLGVPHRLMRDDDYKGVLITGGSTVVVNQWWAIISCVL